MNLLVKSAGLIFCSFLALCTSAQKPPSKGASTPVIKLQSNADSVQYALGAYLARYVSSLGFSSINPVLFLSGMDDMFSNKPRQIKDSSLLPLLTGYQERQQKTRGKSLEEQLFASLKDQPGVGKLPSGVQYTILKPGTGIRPSAADSVLINFKGALADGTIFEDTYTKKVAIATTPGSVMPGLNEALQLMPMGSMWQLYIPSVMGYGDRGNPPVIPPNSALVMIVELILVKRNG